MTKKIPPKWPILAFALLLGAMGLAIVALPLLIVGGADNTELQQRTTRIGGALLSVGVVVFIIYLFKRNQ
ncbi:MAG: hypothetical protein JJ901_03220 [Erythrobacter sp.]|uniref:hypothetical protein n=1 Tax=Erythrobacter sp. TaxID=1042 RepID=UPI001B1E3D8C|nr:hypothetical protein [Erythrobacter sp.]MBO6767300.1 hypothetical protein [Erythrobacter sp.]